MQQVIRYTDDEGVCFQIRDELIFGKFARVGVPLPNLKIADESGDQQHVPIVSGDYYHCILKRCFYSEGQTCRSPRTSNHPGHGTDRNICVHCSPNLTARTGETRLDLRPLTGMSLHEI